MIMGILNVTPDSFSDGGRYTDPDSAVRQGIAMVNEGAHIIDIGGESTRPNAEPVAADEETRRVIPVIERLAAEVPVPISIDTVKPEVARAALDSGASLINDVAANREDEAMWKLAAEFQAGYVAMHMQGTPRTMQLNPEYSDVTDEVDQFFKNRIDRILAAGLQRDYLILDVGIGFGKTLEHNLELLRGLQRFTKLNRPILLGASRKSFIGTVSNAEVDDRLAGSLACAIWGRQKGVHLFRVHDVRASIQALEMYEILAQGSK